MMEDKALGSYDSPEGVQTVSLTRQQKGGLARAANLSAERRREIAINANKARWAKKALDIQASKAE
jgi:hypothetical protein